MAWGYLVIAGIFEMFSVIMINKMYVDRHWMPAVMMVLGFCMSFFLLSLAMQTLPMGTAYAIWTGIGASGGAIFGMLFYNESKDWRRIVCIALIISATIGLKLVS
ncbi:DMT family transporter [Ureibacillus sp. NPDC094379]